VQRQQVGHEGSTWVESISLDRGMSRMKASPEFELILAITITCQGEGVTKDESKKLL